jgi:hypothetical protein
MPRCYTYIKFPKTGLGNLLLIWARANRFASINNIPLISSAWWGFRWGAWLRNENKKRLYFGYFKESSWLQRCWLAIKMHTGTVVKNPLIKQADTTQNLVYLFDTISTGNDVFADIRDHRQQTRQALYQLLHPAMAKQVEHLPAPVMGVHIRRGDFKIGNQTTDLSFFIDCINAVRDIAGEQWPVTIFTDASKDEIAPVLMLPQVTLATPQADILDLLQFSKSRVLVLSQSSTFSYWAAFLSDAIVLRPYNDWQKQLKNDADKNKYPEISWQINHEGCRQLLATALQGQSYSSTK